MGRNPIAWEMNQQTDKRTRSQALGSSPAPGPNACELYEPIKNRKDLPQMGPHGVFPEVVAYCNMTRPVFTASEVHPIAIIIVIHRGGKTEVLSPSRFSHTSSTATSYADFPRPAKKRILPLRLPVHLVPPGRMSLPVLPPWR